VDKSDCKNRLTGLSSWGWTLMADKKRRSVLRGGLFDTPFQHLGDHGVQPPPRAEEEFGGLTVVLSGERSFPLGGQEIRKQLQQLGVLRKLLYDAAERLN